MVSQISRTYDFDRKFLEKRCGLSAGVYGIYDITESYNSVLISSSHWQCFCKKAICRVPHREHTKGNGKILVAGKHLNLGVRGPGEEPSWGETRSSGTGGSHPGQES